MVFFLSHTNWLLVQEQFLIDPDLYWYERIQYANRPVNFGLFLDSMPHRWGRVLMQRKAVLDESKPHRKLNEIDFLLGVYDETKMGGLRFKLQEEGEFLHNESLFSIPPMSDLRELQYASEMLEQDNDEDIRPWLMLLLAPGSSLSGARPKALVRDEQGNFG